MRVWILIPDYYSTHEGYGTIEGVYATEAMAKRRKNALQLYGNSSKLVILAMRVERPRKKKRK